MRSQLSDLTVQDSLSQWRTKMSSTGREWEERQRALQAQKDIMARHYSALKQAMDHFRAQQNTRLKHLSANRYQTQGSNTVLACTCPSMSLPGR